MYFRFLIPHFSRYAGVLTNLTKKTSSYVDRALPHSALFTFNYLKTKLVAEPLVSHPRPGINYHLSTDAAAGDDEHPGGFGAVLTQIWPDSTEHVIAYASRSLKPNEKNYSAYLLELAAAAWAIDHFSVYLLGRHFTLYTDHKPLETLSKVHKKTLNRLQEQMLEYTFKIEYKPGAENTAADALSSNVVSTPTQVFIATMKDDSGELISAQKNDAFCQDVCTCLTKGDLPSHTLGYKNKVPSPLQSLPICEEPNFRVHMDLFVPLRCRSLSGKKYIMVITDAFSKYTKLVAIPDKTAISVAKAFFEAWICRHGRIQR